jgi:hypothetical protein
MKVSVDKVTILLGGNATGAMYANTTRMSDHLAHHMLGHFILVATYREVGVTVKIWLFTSGNYKLWPFYLRVTIYLALFISTNKIVNYIIIL